MPPVRLLLACGLVAPALSLVADVLACARWRTYRPVAQSMSELGAIGAPTRDLVTGLNLARDLSLAAFAAGVCKSSGGDPAMRAMGGLLLANATSDAVASAFLPRDYAQPTWSGRNTANTLVMATGVACYMAAMVAGALAPLGRFRAVSVGVPLSYLGLTALALSLAARRQTPPVTTGAQERTMAYSYQLWIAALAAALMRQEARRHASPAS